MTKECASQQSVFLLRKRVEHRISTWPGNPSPRYRPKELKMEIQIDICTLMFTAVYVWSIHTVD